MILSLAVAAALLAGCGNKPRAPDWQMNAHDSLERYVTAYMTGNARVEAAEFERARNALSATGQAGLVARAELTRCAARVASLAVEPCEGFERLRADAPAAERAYADYLAGRIAPTDVPLLPAQHRAVAAGQGDAAALGAIEDPLSRLVAAGVLFRSGRASPPVLVLASDTASAQGWRRPLLAWLGVQAQRAEQAGATEEAQRLRRRMALVAGEK
ncbi:hypothetical protein EEB15_01440 [Ramlibacter sp. WS9]|nr:hypothetical protein EEB15_01440 [Ramlibacter sp. WS9]